MKGGSWTFRGGDETPSTPAAKKGTLFYDYTGPMFKFVADDGTVHTLRGPEGAPGNKIAGTNAQTGTAYTIAPSDVNKNVRCSNTNAITVTIPASADASFSVNSIVYLSQGGAGTISVTGANGVTVNNAHATSGVGTWLSLVQVATDEWDVVGGAL